MHTLCRHALILSVGAMLSACSPGIYYPFGNPNAKPETFGTVAAPAQSYATLVAVDDSGKVVTPTPPPENKNRVSVLVPG